MAMLTPAGNAPLAQATDLFYGVGGAESTVAMRLADMGMPAHWVGRVGQDGFGTRIINDLRSHGIGIGRVEIDTDVLIGPYVKIPAAMDSGTKESSVFYYRQGSAVSAMSPALLANPAVSGPLDDVGLIHLSGITAALSPEGRDMLAEILAALRHDRLISFDVNSRESLWRDTGKAMLRTLANQSDVVLAGADEALPTFGTNDESGLRALLPDTAVIALKNAATSAIALMRDVERIEVPALRVQVLEPVGAGDTFAAGYLSGMLLGLDQRASLRRRHVSAAYTLTAPGDRGPLPGLDTLERILTCSETEWADTQVAPGRINSAALAVGSAGVRTRSAHWHWCPNRPTRRPTSMNPPQYLTPQDLRDAPVFQNWLDRSIALDCVKTTEHSHSEHSRGANPRICSNS